MAQTPWGDLPVSDAHVHFFSHEFYSGLGRQMGGTSAQDVGASLGWEIPTPDPVLLAGRWVEELDRHGVSRACLIASAPGDEASVAAAVSAYPDRFRGLFMFDPLQPDATDRLTRAALNRGLHCVCLFPAMHRYSVTDSRLDRTFEIASRYSLAVFVHCGALSIGVRKKLGLKSLFDMRFSSPLDLHARALAFPDVRFIVPHFGAGMFREALMLADLCPNVWLDTSSSNGWMKYENLELPEVFRRSLNVIGPERLLFGTDSSFFSRGWQVGILRQQAAALHQSGLGADDARRILHTNMESVFLPRAAAFEGDAASKAADVDQSNSAAYAQRSGSVSDS